MNAMIVFYLCKTLCPGEYGVVGSAYACPTTSLSSVGSRRTISRNIVWQTGKFERPDVMPFDEGFNRRKRSLYIAGGAYG